MPAATETPSSVGRTCAGPLEFFRAIVHRTALNPNVKYEVLQAVETLREYLDTREQPGLEYLFAAALMESCFAPAKDAEGVYNVLLGKFQSFDRRRQELTVTPQSLPLAPRAAQLQRLVLLRHQRVTLIRAFHLAQAIDCDGPWTKSEEKDEMFAMLMKLLTGYVRAGQQTP